jgi:hypothetical protein
VPCGNTLRSDEREEEPVEREETLEFARALMKEVWEPFDSSAVAKFYHRDVVGHHRRPNETQKLVYADVVNRLDWDERTNTNAVFDYGDIIADEDRFAIRYAYRADFVPHGGGGMQDRHTAAAGGKIDVEMIYFYHLRGGKVSEFWLQANVDFDYKAKP